MIQQYNKQQEFCKMVNEHILSIPILFYEKFEILFHTSINLSDQDQVGILCHVFQVCQ